MSGYEAAKKKAEELKEEKAAADAEKAKGAEEAKNELAVIAQNPTLAKMYRDNAKVGSDNLGGSSPILKVLNVGKSSSVEMADGSEPKNGWFFYGPTGEQFQEVECHILSISRGYRAEPLQPKPDQKKQFNQLMAGVIVNDGRLLPFISYVTGSKLSAMWDFGKDAAKFTRAKPVGIPLFALRVKLKTHSQPNPNGGLIWLIDFEIMKNEDGSPVLVTDIDEFEFLKKTVEQMEEVMDAIIDRKAVEEQEEPTPIRAEEPVRDSGEEASDNSESEPLPFD